MRDETRTKQSENYSGIQRCSVNYFATFSAERPQRRCPDAAIQIPGSNYRPSSCSNFITALTRQRASLYSYDFYSTLPSSSRPLPPQVLSPLSASNCPCASLRPVEYVCCVFPSFTSLRPLYFCLITSHALVSVSVRV